MLKKAANYLRTHGLSKTFQRAARVLVPERLRGFGIVRRRLALRRGLEVGGPTGLFQPRQLIPFYPLVAALDNVNFSAQTLWEGRLEEGETFHFDRGRRTGRQYLREAADLRGIPDQAYDFLASSHTLEHLANPLKSLREWLRVVRPGGSLLLVVPHQEGTFDHRRPVTPLAHLIEDSERNTGEDDLTHLPEILERHDLARDKEAGDLNAFRERSLNNLANRCLHHHVFTTARVVELLDYLKLRLLLVEPRRPYHIIVLAEKRPDKAGPPVTVDNARFLGPSAEYRRRSPFAADRSEGSDVNRGFNSGAERTEVEPSDG